ncbi:uncharacterized protein LOC128231127 [Mya arenaria]|uniref:uncharacterized protein LOC128231127 n=1 Tax=Mya arenaria TaxID=6604 RepID=UPI0022E6DED1|nr:uncharacterized protein LOC128231127 [Mya arenaria]
MYCSERFSYSPPVYRIINLIAAIDHKNHLERLNRVWNKKKRLAILSPRIPSERQKTYPYKESLKKQILMRHLTNNFGMGRKAVMEKHAPRRISSHL